MKESTSKITKDSNAIANQVVQKKQMGKSLPSAPTIQLDNGDEKEHSTDATGNSAASAYDSSSFTESSGADDAKSTASSPASSVYGAYRAPVPTGGLVLGDDDKSSSTDSAPASKYNSAYQSLSAETTGLGGDTDEGKDGRKEGKARAGAKYQNVVETGDGMKEYDTDVQAAGTSTAMKSKTLYAESDEDKQRFGTSFKDGKLHDAKGLVDTQGDQAARAKGSVGGRHIYTMNDTGRIDAADAIGETNKEEEKAKSEGSDVQKRLHHSTFNAGGDVAAAGELGVRKGQVESFSDVSGHYMPGSKQMYNMASELKDQGAGVEKINAEFLNKKGEKSKDGRMRAGALEVLGWGEGKDASDENKDKIEGNIRSSHSKKDAVMAELLEKKKRVD